MNKTDESSLVSTSPDAHLNPSHGQRRQIALVSQDSVSPAAGRLQPNEAAGYFMLAPETWDSLERQCTALVQGQALHSSISTPAKAMVIAMKGIEMGLPITAAWSGMRIIDGEVTILGKLALRLIQQRVVEKGGVCRMLPVPAGEDSKRAGWAMARPGDPPVEFWFTWEDAERGGLLKVRKRDGTWIETPAYKKFPDRMLAWRALAKGAAVTFADILQGCLIAEEMSHKDPEFLVTQEHEASTPAVSGERTFHTSAPPRVELGKGHQEVRKTSQLVEEFVVRLAELETVPEDTTEEAWYKGARRDKWADLTDRCVRGTAPTQEEAHMMQELLKADLRYLKEAILNRDLMAAHEAEKAKHEDDAGPDQPLGGSPSGA